MTTARIRARCVLPLITILACAPAIARGMEPAVPSVGAQQETDAVLPAHPIEPDRPDVTNGTHLVDPGVVQLETGYQHVRIASAQHSLGTPVTMRLGLTTWVELRVSSDGYVRQCEGRTCAGGMGNVQAGAKLRLVSDSHQMPVLSLLPVVNLPVASSTKGLGSGDADYTLTMLTGADVWGGAHVDANYGIGAIGAGNGAPHFTQQLVSVSASHNLGERLSPYLETYWFSRQESHGGHVLSMDGGVIYTVSARLAVDGGVAVGASAASPDVSVFGGVSMILGNVFGDVGSLGRQRRLARVQGATRR